MSDSRHENESGLIIDPAVLADIQAQCRRRAAELEAEAQALHLADRTPEALEAINEAEALAERFEHRSVFSRLHRLRGVFLAAMGADETQIEAAFCEAIRIAKGQKSVSLEKRAEDIYAEYRRQKASGSSGVRLPLW